MCPQIGLRQVKDEDSRQHITCKDNILIISRKRINIARKLTNSDTLAAMNKRLGIQIESKISL
jgi:hypothetical protein